MHKDLPRLLAPAATWRGGGAEEEGEREGGRLQKVKGWEDLKESERPRDKNRRE